MSASPDPSSLSDAALRDRIAYLQSVPEDDAWGDDNLTGAGWRELHALEAERDQREARRCPCCRSYVSNLAPGAICASCAAFPLD
jgi:hypothetical protein